MFEPVTAARQPWFAWLIALAVALLPLHSVIAKVAMQPAALADLGDCHGKKASDANAPACPGCGACHAVQDVVHQAIVLPGHVAVPEAEVGLILHGTTTQPDLHPPLA
jgi:cytochrome c553